MRFLVDAQLPPALARWLVRLPNARRRDLLVWFEKALPAILKSLDAGEVLVEIT